jgi:hypothetical protein
VRTHKILSSETQEPGMIVRSETLIDRMPLVHFTSVPTFTCAPYRSRAGQVEVLLLITTMVIPVSPHPLPKAEFYYEVNCVNHLLINRPPGSGGGCIASLADSWG